MKSYKVKKSWLTSTGMIVILALAMVSTADAGIIYVDDDARGANVGSSWEHAINSLQDALLLAYFYDEPVEIRVAQGSYMPDEGIGIMPGDREASFQLLNNVTIKGGYAGPGTRDPNARNADRFTSILSGDLNNNNNSRIANRDEKSFHVVTASGTDATAVLDGFTITGGNADGPAPHNYGGGMYNDNSNPTLINCTFNGNSAAISGGGMHNNNSNPTLLNCIFNDNSAAISGGGMCNNHSSPALTNCAFTGNTAGNEGGGGMYNIESKPALADCIFSEHFTTGHGGGMNNSNSYLELLNCEFRANSSQRSGGGLSIDSYSYIILINCIFSRNSAQVGGGMALSYSNDSLLYNCTFSSNSADDGGGGISNNDGSLSLTNCILWGDTPDEIAGSAYVSYSDIEDGWYGRSEGNIDIDPLFVDPDIGDYHLKSQAGRWDPISESWVIDEVSSPCIDAGDTESPVGLERFPNGGRINIGAYGGTPQASLSPRDTQLSTFQASNPYPPDEAENISIDVTLSWTPGLNATRHNVYFGTDLEVVSQANLIGGRGTQVSINQIEPHFDPGILSSSQTYYWRVDEVIGEDITTGVVWSFTTQSSSAPPKGRTCFTAETPVWVNGILIPISKAGTEQTISRVESIGKIQEVQEHEGTFTCYDVLLQSGNCISVAECHYFLEESGRWISLQELKAGTKLQTQNSSIEIISVTKRPMPYVGKVYNLKIEGSDRYLVGEDAIIVRDY